MTCCVCEKEKPDNLIILGKNICTDCEDSLMSARVNEPSYDEWIARIESTVLKYDESNLKHT